LVFNRIKTLTAFVITIAVVTSGCGFTQSAPNADSGTVKVALSSDSSKPGGQPGVLESATITSISLMIEASDMTTINTTIPTGTLETSLDVPAGGNRTFTATVTIAGQNFYGYANYVDIAAGSSTTVDIPITVSGSIYTVGGTVTALSGSGLTLQDNGGDNLAVSSNGTFRFSTYRNSSYSYNVTVLTQPSSPNQTCAVTNPTGTVIAGTTLESVTVTCTTVTYAVGGSVSGLTGGTLVLQNNGGDNLSITADGTFSFSTPIADGSTYSVTVSSQPTGQTCSVASGGGTISGVAVTDVSVTCVAGTLYTIGGTISGATGTLDLDMYNGSTMDVLNAVSNGSFTFPTAQVNGITYSVTVSVPPSGQTCTVTGGGNGDGTGTISGANVTNVLITCTTTTTPKSWGTEALIENSSNVISQGSAYIAAGPGGDMFAVWAENNGSNLSIFANHKTSSGSWQPITEEIKKSGTDSTYTDPRVHVDSSGNAMAVWSNYGGATTTVSITFYLLSNPALGGSPGWNLSEAPVSYPLYDANYGHGNMFPNGEYIVIYSQSDGSGNTTVMERHSVSGSLPAATAIGSTTPNSSNYKSHLKVAVSSNNTNAIAVWRDAGNIMASNYDGSSWSPSEVSIESLTTSSLYEPHVAMDSSGNGIVVWYDSSSSNLYANYYDFGTGLWQTEQIISSGGQSLIGHGYVAMAANGNAIAVWGHFNSIDNEYNTWANTFNGTTWASAERLEFNIGTAYGQRVAIDSSGNAMAVWYQNDGTRYNIWANFFDGSNWGTAELIETNNVGDAEYPWVAADPVTDNFNAVWTQDNGTVWDVYTNIYQ